MALYRRDSPFHVCEIPGSFILRREIPCAIFVREILHIVPAGSRFAPKTSSSQ